MNGDRRSDVGGRTSLAHALTTAGIAALLAIRAGAALAAPAAVSADETGSSPVPAPPNIVLIIGDDVAWNDFGFMGSDAVHTPHLDRLASRGTVFTHAFAPVSICGPVLRSLLTGQSPQTVARGLEEASRPRRPLPALRDVFETLPEKLRERGYVSFQGGKFFEGAFADGGFTHGMTVARSAQARDGGRVRRGPSAVVRGVGGRGLGRETMQPLWDFLDAHSAGPFFVWYAPMLPHLPFDAPEEFARHYAGDPVQLRGYRANVTRFDETVGQLLRRLEALNIRENTLVLYLADNGWDPSSGGGRLGLGGPKGKGSLFELGVRTALVVSLPGVVRAGERDARLVSLLDVYPTLLDFSGTPHRPGTPHRSGTAQRSGTRHRSGSPRRSTAGSSLYPLLTGAGDFHREFVVGGPGTKGRRSRFLRTARWRYISDEDLNESLYLIEHDPLEENDLAAAYPELLQGMRRELIRQLSSRR